MPAFTRSLSEGWYRLWRGDIDRHVAFWLVWILPLLVLGGIASQARSVTVDLAGLVLSLLASVVVWRSAARPLGSRWVSYLYRAAVVLYWMAVAITGLAAVFLRG